MRLVTDQISNPTWARSLAEITALLLARGGSKPVDWLAERRGLYHLGGDGYCSRQEWGEAILRLDSHPEEQIAQAIAPALTLDFPTAAERPLFSALDCTHFIQTFHLQLPPWQEALRQALDTE